MGCGCVYQARGLLDAGSELLGSYWQSDQMVETRE